MKEINIKETLDQLVDNQLTIEDLFQEHYARLSDMRPNSVFKFHVLMPQTVPDLNNIDEYKLLSKLKDGSYLVVTPDGKQFIIPMYDASVARVDFIYQDVPDDWIEDPADEGEFLDT
jgi:hypothetical protein